MKVIVLGYNEAGNSAKPSLVYMGQDSDAATKAISEEEYFRYEIFENPMPTRRYVRPTKEEKAAIKAAKEQRAKEEAEAKKQEASAKKKAAKKVATKE